MHEAVFTFKNTEEEKQMRSEVLSASRSLNFQRFKEHVLCEPYSTYNPTITDSVGALSVMLLKSTTGCAR